METDFVENVTVEPSSAVPVVVVVVVVLLVVLRELDVLVVLVVLVALDVLDVLDVPDELDVLVVVTVVVREFPVVVSVFSVEVVEAVAVCWGGGSMDVASGPAAGCSSAAGSAVVCSTGALGGGSSARAVSAARANPAYTPAPSTPAASARRHQGRPTAGSARSSSVPGEGVTQRKLGTGPSRPLCKAARRNLPPVCPGPHLIG